MNALLAPPSETALRSYDRLTAGVREMLGPDHAFVVFGGEDMPEVPGAVDGLDEPSLRRLAEWRIDPAVEARVAELGRRANAGTLTAEEQDEVRGYLAADDFLAVLKLSAAMRLGRTLPG